jgi:uncharacterized circularly permuted ATP-grasp superfamily protein
MPIDWNEYQPSEFFDELFAAPGNARPAAAQLAQYLASLGLRELAERQGDAERSIAEMGITFTVYTEGQNIDRAWPFDVIPRTIEAGEWARIERGLRQRLTALNHFIDDLYHERRVIAAGVVPDDIISTSANFLPECIGANPPFGVWANICGTDLVRDGDGTVYVLEDNLRVPSGVSYMLENRIITKQVFPEMFEHASIMPVDDYASQLFDMLASLSPRKVDYPRVVVLTPGIYNSAYFEHSYLAQRMGVDLVQGDGGFQLRAFLRGEAGDSGFGDLVEEGVDLRHRSVFGRAFRCHDWLPGRQIGQDAEVGFAFPEPEIGQH